MHPTIEFPGALAPILDELRAPLYPKPLREAGRRARLGIEASLAAGVRIEPGDFTGEKHLDFLVADLASFLERAMGVRQVRNGYPIRMVRAAPGPCPAGAVEAYSVRVRADSCTLVAEDLAGLRRAVFWIEDEMALRRAPILPLGRQLRWTRIRTRVSRSPLAPYRWMSGWELEDENDYYPEPYLARLAHAGVNGVWVSGLFRNLLASPVIPELGPPVHRLGKLRRLVEKTAPYGIRVYLFCIEPRALPEGHPAARRHPEIVGAHGSLCPSVPLVLEYVRRAMRDLATEVPGLAGVINIFNGERATTCWMNADYVQACPRCRVRSKARVLSETLDAFAAGIRDAGSSAEFLAWTYMMDPKTRSMTTLPVAPMLEVVEKSGPDIVWLGNFEHGGSKKIGARTVGIHEYALSYIGPSPLFTELARAVRAAGRQVWAKLQIGASYELPSVPYLPIPGVVYEKVSRLPGLGVSGALLHWIPGGFPGPMMKAAGEAAFEPRLEKPAFLRRLAGITWGETRADAVAEAWERFSAAWQMYPFHNAVLYFGPLTRAPAYPLYLETEPRPALPYNWGFDRSRRPQPFPDDLERWLGPFTPEEIAAGFRGLAKAWRRGLRRLRALPGEEKDPEWRKHLALAEAIPRQCLSAADVYEFYRLRNQLRDGEAAQHAARLRAMRRIVRHSLRLARSMPALVRRAPALGFHPEMYAYSYTIPLIAAKIVQLQRVLSMLDLWLESGVDARVFARSVEALERERPDRAPDLWGD